MSWTKLVENVHITQWLTEAIIYLTKKQEKYTDRLKQQLKRIPMTMSTLNFDEGLEVFVSLHHLDLKRKINHRINLFRNQIREKLYEEQLYSFGLYNEQVCLILVVIRNLL